MKRLLWFVTLVALAIAPCAAQAQPTAWSPSMVGVGPHGYDWMIGRWSCTNSMPSPMGGPSTSMSTVTASNGGGVFFRNTGKNFDNSYYAVYVSKTKAWLSPFIFGDGSYGSESTTRTGKKIVWTGSVFDTASGKTMQVRDTDVMLSATKYTDLGEYQSGGIWKAQYNLTCTKS
jgi:hypothetical protein